MNTQLSELEKVKHRIRSLTAKTVSNGCTEEEAMSAASKVGHLLEQYFLNMNEVELRQETCIQVAVAIPGNNQRPIRHAVTTIANFCDCRVWTSGYKNHRFYQFFGIDSDVEMAVYLYKMIDSALSNAVDAYKVSGNAPIGQGRGVLKVATSSFQKGMVHRVTSRLISMMHDKDKNVESQMAKQNAASPGNGTALVLVKHKIVADAFQKLGMKLTATKVYSFSRNTAAYDHGSAAGNKVNLGRPVNASDTRRLS